ncbi:uncharacterized protein LOC117788936 [Drosophila innubila]|uniref:uncharacterized protein LOC117788936 n=1 Tax=Drosophila innubila TaxID=198719 RepID=UPI00148C7745|nr:uncharacterized protein LOC117788936 [Drosophila innubila]
MYKCTICGLKKSELGSNPEFEFRRRRHPTEESQVEGMSDWCSKCEALRFFFKSDVAKNPAQHLDEQKPEKRLSNHVLETTIKCWSAKDRQSKGYKDVGKQHRVTRHDAHKVMMQEIMNGLPSQLPRGSMWERKVRSLSEDRSRRREKVNPAIGRRSRSVVNDSTQQRAKMAKQQAESHRRHIRDIAKLEALKPVQHVNLDFPTAKIIEVQELDEDDNDTSLNSSPRPKIRLPFDKEQLEELMSPWREDVQKRVSESSKKKKTKEHRGKDNRQPETAANRQRHCGGVTTTMKKLTKNEMSRMMHELQEQEKKQKLKTKLKEKKNLMSEWKRIRRCVDDECVRVKTELNELKLQADLDKEGHRRHKLDGRKDRIRGGAHILVLNPNDEQQIERMKEKTIGDALDEKIEHMLDALQENNKQIEVTTEQEEEIVEPTASPAEQSDDENNMLKATCEITKISPTRPKRVLSKLNILMSTVQRARFCGFAEDPQELLKRLDESVLKNDPPLPQFETMPCARQDLVNLLHIKREFLLPNQIRPLKVCRSPIYCPDSDCRRMFFISDFNEHLTHEHPSLAMERIAPCQAKTFFMDTNITLLDKAKCNMVYFIRDKFIDNTTNNHPDLIPVLVMSARLRLHELFTPNYDPSSQLRPNPHFGPDSEIFLIWLTSLRPDDTKIMGTISVWPTSSNPLVEHLLVHTNEVYNIRSSQKLKNIYNSNRIVVLSGNLVNRMTNGGKNLLAVQVLIH